MLQAHISSYSALLLIALFISVPALAGAQLARATVEKPMFELIENREGYQVRHYAACVVAQVSVPLDTEDAMSKGFRPLADYIFGNNTAKSKLAMTSPVTQEVAKEEKAAKSEKIAMTSPVVQEVGAPEAQGPAMHTVQFIMPSEYTLETLPTPNNPAVTLANREARTYAVVKFSGRGNDEQMREKEKELRELLARDSATVTGTPLYARYDPPWTLPLLRRNEVMLPIVMPEKPKK